MGQAKLKIGCTIAGQFIKKGTLVEVLDINDFRVQSIWPNIKPNNDTTPIQFLHLNFPIFVLNYKLEFLS